MCNDNFGMCLRAGLDTTSFPIPNDEVALSIATTYPFTVSRETNLACISGHGVTCKPLLPILAEVICAVYENLVIQWLRCKVFFYSVRVGISWFSIRVIDGILEGCSVTDGIECMCGSAMYLITTGISKSQALIVLSSDVVTNRRFSSTKVMVLTGPRCWSYSWVISPEFMSYWRKTVRWPLNAWGMHSLVWSSCLTFQLRICSVCPRQGEIVRRKGSFHFRNAEYIVLSRYPIVSWSGHSYRTKSVGHHWKTSNPWQPWYDHKMYANNFRGYRCPTTVIN